MPKEAEARDVFKCDVCGKVVKVFIKGATAQCTDDHYDKVGKKKTAHMVSIKGEK